MHDRARWQHQLWMTDDSRGGRGLACISWRGGGLLQRQGVHRRSLNTLNWNGRVNAYRWTHTAADLNICAQTKHRLAHSLMHTNPRASQASSNLFDTVITAHTDSSDGWTNILGWAATLSTFLSLLSAELFFLCLRTYLQTCFTQIFQIPAVAGGGCERHLITTHYSALTV